MKSILLTALTLIFICQSAYGSNKHESIIITFDHHAETKIALISYIPEKSDADLSVIGRQPFVDYKKKLSESEKRAASGNHTSIFNLGVMYLKEPHSNIDFKKAFSTFSKLSNSDSKNIRMKSCYILGYMSLCGLGTPQNFLEANGYLSEASHSHNSKAIYLLAVSYSQPESVFYSPEMAFNLMQALAKLNDSRAQCHLNRLYCDPFGPKLNVLFADKCFLFAKTGLSNGLNSLQESRLFLKSIQEVPEPPKLTDLPLSFFIEVARYLRNQDAHNFCKSFKRVHNLTDQIRYDLIRRYRAIGQNFFESFVNLDFKSWKLHEKTPAKIQDLAHEFYFSGRASDDPLTKICYFLAAARAGHNKALHEGGLVLKDTPHSVIPCDMTFDTLLAKIPEYNDPVIRNWDIMNMNTPLIGNTTVFNVYNETDELVSDNNSNIYERILKCGDKNEASDELDHIIRQIFLIIDKSIEKIGSLKTSDETEKTVLKIFMRYMKESYEYKLRSAIPFGLMSLIEDHKHIDLDDEGCKFRDEDRLFIQSVQSFNPEIARFFQEQSKLLCKPDIREYELQDALFMSTPLYWRLMATFYKNNRKPLKEEHARHSFLNLCTNCEEIGFLADCIYERCATEDNVNPMVLSSRVREANHLYMTAALLGDKSCTNKLASLSCSQFCSFRESRNNRVLNLDEEALDLETDFEPCIAMILQLNALRFPRCGDIFNSMHSYLKLFSVEESDGCEGNVFNNRTEAAAEILFRIISEEED